MTLNFRHLLCCYYLAFRTASHKTAAVREFLFALGRSVGRSGCGQEAQKADRPQTGGRDRGRAGAGAGRPVPGRVQAGARGHLLFRRDKALDFRVREERAGASAAQHSCPGAG